MMNREVPQVMDYYGFTFSFIEKKKKQAMHLFYIWLTGFAEQTLLQ